MPAPGLRAPFRGFAFWSFLALFCAGCADNKPVGPPLSTGGSTPAPSTGAAPKAGVKRLIMLTNGDDPFWDAMRRGMEKAQEEFKLSDAGYQAVLDKGDFSETAQIDKLKQYASQSDIAVVAISAVNATNDSIAEVMRELRKKGVEVVCIDSDMDKSLKDTRFAYLGTNNLIAGRELGKAAAALLPEGGEYATFVGRKEVQNAIERIGGFQEGAGDKFKSADSLGDQGDQNIAQENVKTTLNNHPDIKALVGIWSYNSPAIVSVVQDRKIRDKTKVLVFDCHPGTIDGFANGMIDVALVQNPYQMGHLGTQLMLALAQKDGKAIQAIYPDYDPATGKFAKDDGDIYTTELRIVVPDSDSPAVKADLFDKGTKYFQFKDFKAWLDERKLIGS
jgi:ribose transport system substrate-binding protein